MSGSGCNSMGCLNSGIWYFGGKLLCHSCLKLAKEKSTMFDKECCIAGCVSPGVHCLDGRWYCYTCWREEGKGGRPSPQDTVSDRISGSVQESDTKSVPSNPDYIGTGELEADYVRGEAIRANGTGILVDQTLLPPVSDSVAEECRKEIELARRRGWKKSD